MLRLRVPVLVAISPPYTGWGLALVASSMEITMCDLSAAVHFELVGERSIRVTFNDPKWLERAKLANDSSNFHDTERLMEFFDKAIGIPFIAMSYDSEAFYLECEFD